jgi:hypothetical protein
VDRSTPRDPRPGALWPILYNGEQAGKLFQDENYGPSKPWHATTRELYWKFASDAPTGVGFDVAAFATAQQALDAWGRSADQILDWAEGKSVHTGYGNKGPQRRAGEARRYPQPKLPPRQFVAPRVRDFNTLDDLVRHARDELGATHVSFEHGTHGNVIYFPRKDGQYEAASTWQKAGYWHAQGPGSREIVRHLPRGAQAIGRGQPEHESGQDESWSYDDDSEESKRRRGVTSEARRAPRRRRAPTEWTTDNTEISTWFERDRASVVLNTLDGATIIEWWDDDVHEAVQDGFLDPRDWHGSAVEYANQMGAQPQAGVREAPRRISAPPLRWSFDGVAAGRKGEYRLGKTRNGWTVILNGATSMGDWASVELAKDRAERYDAEPREAREAPRSTRRPPERAPGARRRARTRR